MLSPTGHYHTYEEIAPLIQRYLIENLSVSVNVAILPEIKTTGHRLHVAVQLHNVDDSFSVAFDSTPILLPSENA